MGKAQRSSIWMALGLVGLFASFVGCSGSVQNDTGCDYDGKHYAEGDSFPANDSCNHCSCGKHGDVSCTLIGCDPTPAKDCVDAAGVHYALGQPVPDASCDQCVCAQNGYISCTGCGDTTTPTCAELVSEVKASLSDVQRCQSAADCGQRIPNSSCGCTRDLIARKDADLTPYLKQRANAIERGCSLEGGSDCDCPNADGFACVNQACTWNYKVIEPNPSCEPYDAAQLCVRGTPSADGELLAAGDPLQVTVRSAGCLSSSCSKVMQASCTIDSGASFAVEANFCVANIDPSGSIGCTADCGTAHADCSFGQPLTAGEHQVKLGSIAVGFQVPSKLPAGGLCASVR